jgi:hypothetical protein
VVGGDKGGGEGCVRQSGVVELTGGNQDGYRDE